MRRARSGQPSVTPDDANVPPRSLARLLLDPTIGSFFTARVLGSVGIWISNVVAAVVVYDITGSALMVGVVSVAQFGAQIFLSPYMGAVADRGNRQKQASVGQFITGSGPGLLALVYLINGSELSSPWPVFGAALIIGIGFTVGAPATQALVPSLGRPSELSSVVVLATAPMTIGRTIGPGLGALLLLTAGPGVAFAVASASQIVLAIVIRRISFRPIETVATSDRSVMGGIRYLRTDVGTLLLLFGVAALGFGIDPIITLSPSIAAELGGGTTLVAWITSGFGLGAACYLPVFGFIRDRLTTATMGVYGMTLMAVSLGAMALSPTAGLAVVASFFAGLGMMSSMTSLSTLIQERIPEMVRGRIMALWLVAFVGSRPFAAVMNGWIADTWSNEMALGIVVVLMLTMSYFIRPTNPRIAT